MRYLSSQRTDCALAGRVSPKMRDINLRRPVSTYRDESVEAKWSDIREYDRDFEAGKVVGSGGGGGSSQRGSAGTPDSESFKLTLSAREKFVEFKRNSGRKLVSMKNQLAGRYKKAEYRDGDYRSDICTSPTGSDSRPSSVIGNIGAVGRGIKSSKSLQNLEQITKDGLRQVADRTSYIGQNLKHRCSSKLDLNQLAPKQRHYEELNDAESDDDLRRSAHQHNLF